MRTFHCTLHFPGEGALVLSHAPGVRDRVANSPSSGQCWSHDCAVDMSKAVHRRAARRKERVRKLDVDDVAAQTLKKLREVCAAQLRCVPFQHLLPCDMKPAEVLLL